MVLQMYDIARKCDKVQQSQPENEKVTVRLDLEGEDARIFNMIKRIRGLKANAAVVLQLVTEDAQRKGLMTPR